MTITAPRRKKASFTPPYWRVSHVLVVREDSEATVEDLLAAGSIGVQRGTPDAQFLVQLATKNELKVSQFSSTSLAIEDVVVGRLSSAAMDDVAANAAIRKGKAIKVLGEFGMPPDEYGYAVRRDDTELLRKLSEGLEKLKKSPRWQELIDEYIEKN